MQVVQHMFEIMDTDQMALTQAHREKQEIEDLWKQEKDKRKTSQRVSYGGEGRGEGAGGRGKGAGGRGLGGGGGA